jgi:hypothetical protein
VSLFVNMTGGARLPRVRHEFGLGYPLGILVCVSAYEHLKKRVVCVLLLFVFETVFVGQCVQSPPKLTVL